MVFAVRRMEKVRGQNELVELSFAGKFKAEDPQRFVMDSSTRNVKKFFLDAVRLMRVSHHITVHP